MHTVKCHVKTGVMQQKPSNAKMATEAPEARSEAWSRFYLPALRRNPPCANLDLGFLHNCETVSVVEAAQFVVFSSGSPSKLMRTNSYLKQTNNKNENIKLVKFDGPEPLSKVKTIFFPASQQLRIRGPWHWRALAGDWLEVCRGTCRAQPESRVTGSLLLLSTDTSSPFILDFRSPAQAPCPRIVFSRHVNFSLPSYLFL